MMGGAILKLSELKDKEHKMLFDALQKINAKVDASNDKYDKLLNKIDECYSNTLLAMGQGLKMSRDVINLTKDSTRNHFRLSHVEDKIKELEEQNQKIINERLNEK